jgi:hypothetical protein
MEAVPSQEAIGLPPAATIIVYPARGSDIRLLLSTQVLDLASGAGAFACADRLHAVLANLLSSEF